MRRRKSLGTETMANAEGGNATRRPFRSTLGFSPFAEYWRTFVLFVQQVLRARPTTGSNRTGLNGRWNAATGRPATRRRTAASCWSTCTTCTRAITATRACWCARSARWPTCWTSRCWRARKWCRPPTPYSPGWPWPTCWSWSSTCRSPITCTCGRPTIRAPTGSRTTGRCSCCSTRTSRRRSTPYPYGSPSPWPCGGEYIVVRYRRFVYFIYSLFLIRLVVEYLAGLSFVHVSRIRTRYSRTKCLRGVQACHVEQTSAIQFRVWLWNLL